jgi:YD repeat-containing protein
VRAIEDLLAPEEGTLAATYDGVGRLRSADRAGATLAYAYDALGNLVSKEGTAIPFAHPTKPHAPYDAADPTRFVHDANGNLVEHAGRRLGYDARNRLVTASGLEPAAFAYDHSGERIRVEHCAAISDPHPDYEIQSVRLPDGRAARRASRSDPAPALCSWPAFRRKRGVLAEAACAPADADSIRSSRSALLSQRRPSRRPRAAPSARLALLEPAHAVWLCPFQAVIAQIPMAT